MQRWIVPALAALLLAGCGSNSAAPTPGDQASAADSAQPNDTSVKYAGGGDDAAAPNGDALSGLPDTGDTAASADLPAGFTVYPGANVVNVTPINMPQGHGKLVIMSTSDPVDKVITFYKAQAAKAGVTIKRETTNGDMKLMGGDGPSGLSMVVSAAQEAAGTTVQLVVGRGAA